MKLQARTVVSTLVNVLAILIVVGVVAQSMVDANGASSHGKSALVATAHSNEDLSIIPTTADNNNNNIWYTERDLRSKGSKAPDCIPLTPTPAPTKGKGKGRVRIPFPSSTKAPSSSSKGSKGSSSAAPSFFCSEAPSLSPSLSFEPSISVAPSLAPSVSQAPSCAGKGKGRLGFSSCKSVSKGKGSAARGGLAAP